MKFLWYLLFLCSGVVLTGCEKCQKFEYIYLSGPENLVVLESKKNPFKQTYTTTEIPIKFRLSRNEFYIIFQLSEGYVPSMLAQVHARKKGIKLALVGNDVVKLSEAYRRDTGYGLGGEGELKGGYKFQNGIYKFQVVDENNRVLSNEQIHFEIRSDGKRCEYDSF